MPGDLVIADTATAAAPKETQVAGAQDFVLLQVQALLDGSGAAGAFLPALEIVSPSGIVTGRYVGTSVAAGDSAEVTWFPLGSKGTAAASSGVGVEHDDVLVATEPNIDFEDGGGVTWTVTDDPANTRVKIAASAGGGGALPFAMASDISTTLTAGGTITMNLADWFGTTDGTVYSTTLVGGKTYLEILTSGFYALRACCIAQSPTVTGPLLITKFINTGGTPVDTTELDIGQLVVNPVTSGGANRWLVNTDTYIMVNAPANVGVNVQVATTGLSGDITNQHTDVSLTRLGDYVANVLF